MRLAERECAMERTPETCAALDAVRFRQRDARPKATHLVCDACGTRWHVAGMAGAGFTRVGAAVLDSCAVCGEATELTGDRWCHACDAWSSDAPEDCAGDCVLGD
jgi:hypothetical protein